MLVLSLFPGIGLLDRAFEEEGFCVVRGPDVLWGGDVRRFHVPAGKFDGVIGGDPCQSHSSLANLVRAKGLEPRFPDMTGEYKRILCEAQPAWFLRENVPAAPDLALHGYGVAPFMLDNCWLPDEEGLGQEQTRKRRFWFGLKDRPPVSLMDHIELAAFLLPDASRAAYSETVNNDPAAKHRRQAVTYRGEDVPVRIGGSGKVKATAVRSDGQIEGHRTLRRACDSAGRTDRREPGNASTRYSLEEMMRLQGVPVDFFEYSPFTVGAKRKMIGNGVPLAMGRALARAIRLVLEGG